jgi:mannose-6-phosphate isomerase
MTHWQDGDPTAQLTALNAKLIGWLVNDAYPRWADHGIDPHNGGFFETLGQNGLGLAHPRRARVQPRQIYAFAQARALGWQGDAAGIVDRGMRYFTAHYRRSDGLFRTLAAADGSALDERALLYDQAFALLGLASAAEALEARGEFEQRALALRGAIEARLDGGGGSFRSEISEESVRESNPHMHLLEACLAWMDIGNDSGWSAWVRDLATLAVTRFIHDGTGALGEAFTAAWRPAPGLRGRIIEPGHQFEWAWLLLRCERRHPAGLRPAALKLIAVGEEAGIHHGVAVNALLDDLTVQDPNARLWPQTERLKAALLAAQITGDAAYRRMAVAAASSLLPYLDTKVRGLWFDVQLPNGEIPDAPAAASTFYHLVCAIASLDTACKFAA